MEEGFRRADVIVERTYRTQRVDHAYLEPEAAVAWVDGDGVVTIAAAPRKNSCWPTMRPAACR